MPDMKFFIIMAMIFCHIVDDFYLQGILAQMKQKDWWPKFYPSSMYKKDYLVALIMHGFSWSFMVHLPIVAYTMITKSGGYLVIGVSCIGNALAHAIIDHVKCNLKLISLIQDQIMHMLQIALIFVTIFVL